LSESERAVREAQALDKGVSGAEHGDSFGRAKPIQSRKARFSACNTERNTAAKVTGYNLAAEGRDPMYLSLTVPCFVASAKAVEHANDNLLRLFTARDLQGSLLVRLGSGSSIEQVEHVLC
jgi:hypothetical protein